MTNIWWIVKVKLKQLEKEEKYGIVRIAMYSQFNLKNYIKEEYLSRTNVRGGQGYGV